MKWKKGKFEIRVKDLTNKILAMRQSGYISDNGLFGIHRVNDRYAVWVLTHIPTGLSGFADMRFNAVKSFADRLVAADPMGILPKMTYPLTSYRRRQARAIWDAALSEVTA